MEVNAAGVEFAIANFESHPSGNKQNRLRAIVLSLLKNGTRERIRTAESGSLRSKSKCMHLPRISTEKERSDACSRPPAQLVEVRLDF